MDSIDKINILLARHGMTGADLSRLIGASNSVYSQWNTKTTKPSNKSLAKIAEVFNVDVSELMPDNEIKSETMAKSIITFNIDVLLIQKGISKKQFYKDCDITSASYSQWNTGKTKPKLATLERIANYLNVSVAYLLGSDIDEDGVVVLEEIDADSVGETDEKKPSADAESERAKLYASLDTMSRDELLDFVTKAMEVLKEK